MSESGKLALRIAERIENEILDRALRPGHRLGTEAELTERYRVSRAVLYEAIRLVERHQLATTRRGAGGGFFVAEPAEEAVAQLMCAYLDSIRVGIPELFEALRLVQGESVRLAAERAGAYGVAELRAMLESQREPAPPEEEARRFNAFYGRVAALADSPALALFVRALDQAAEHIGLSLRFPRAAAARDWKVLRRCMIRVADAISSGRPGAASEEMVQYLAKLERSFLAREPRSKPRAAGDRKRSDALAREILDEIRRGRHIVGDRLGSERELIERFDVSRAVLREAVRLLEQHGVAEMRRGRGGGLVVAEPDPGWVIRSASAYLSRLRLLARHYKEARLLIEPATAALAAERASEDELAELEGALGEILAFRGSESGDASRCLHERIADLSGNRILALFARVLITAAWGTRARAELPRGALKQIQDNDTGIVGAIVRRDGAQAQRRMREHLALSIGWWEDLYPTGR